MYLNTFTYKKFLLIVLSITFFSSISAQKPKKLGLVFDETTYNFGDVDLWENQPALFTFTNKSKQAITILPIFSESDLEVIFPQKPIYPNESFTVKAIYYTAGKGSFNRKFPLYFSMIPEPIELTIKGNIKSLSPTAYIQCPSAKPMHANSSKVNLIGSVVEIDSEIPLSGSVVRLIGPNNTTLFTDQVGEFGNKMTSGTYQLIVEHPSYQKHVSTLYLGNTTGRVKINLIPKSTQPVLAKNTFTNNKTDSNPIKENEKTTSKQNENLIKEPPLKEDEETENNQNDNFFGNNIPTNNNNNEEPLNFNDNLEKNEIEKKVTTNTPKEEMQEYYDESKEKGIKPNNSVKEENSSYIKTVLTDNAPIESSFDEYVPYNKKSYLNEEAPNIIPTEHASNYIPPSQRNKDEDNTGIFYQPVEEYETYRNSSTKEKIAQNYTPVEKSYNASKIHTIRVFDDKNMIPIEDATIYINSSRNNDPEKYNTDGMGNIEIESDDENLRIIASADGYISNELKILKDEEEGVYRIYLEPISSLFDEIYRNIDEKILAKADEEFFENENTQVENTEAKKENILEIDTFIPIPKKSIEKESKAVALTEDKTPKINLSEEELSIFTPNKKMENESLEKNTSSIIDQNLLAKQDSLETYIDNLMTEQQAILEKLNKIENEKAELEEVLTNKEAENEEEELKKDFANKEKELLDKEALAKIEAEKANPELSRTNFAANNVVFLIDISSSMDKDNRLDLLKQSIKSLVPKLRDIDRVAIIAYNQKTDLVLESVEGTQKEIINNAIDSLKPYGLTYGVNGIQQAYEILEYYYRGDGNNQIILATDGLFSEVNQPISERELFKLVRQKANQENIKLSVVGFGKDDEGDDLMNKLASNGNGKFIKIKNPWEAETVLVREIEIQSKITP